ncbi:hypothetical protein V6N13_062646 [Hibiscus sabdariffa]
MPSLSLYIGVLGDILDSSISIQKMECNKFPSLSVPMAAVLLAIMSPTVTAARNQVMFFSIITNANIRNLWPVFLSSTNQLETVLVKAIYTMTVLNQRRTMWE